MKENFSKCFNLPVGIRVSIETFRPRKVRYRTTNQCNVSSIKMPYFLSKEGGIWKFMRETLFGGDRDCPGRDECHFRSQNWVGQRKSSQYTMDF